MIDLFTTHKPIISNCPRGLKDNIDNWKSNNPSFNFIYYDDCMMEEWMKNNTSERIFRCFDLLNTGAGRADLFRVYRMNVEGGVWFDADLPAFDITKARGDFICLLQENHTVLVKHNHFLNPRYSFMASNPQSKILSLLQEKVISLIENTSREKINIKTINVTGPFVLHALLCDLLNLSNILDLEPEINYIKSFIYINDIIPTPTLSRYKGYDKDLIEMEVKYHQTLNATK